MTWRMEVVTTPQRFLALKPAWSELWSRADSNVFQTFDWLQGWIGAVADRNDIRLRLAIAWDGSRMVGIIPCSIYRRSGVRVLSWAAQLFSDYCDCVVDRAYDSSVILPPLWDALNQAGGFDIISLQQVGPTAVCRPFLQDLAQHRRGLSPGSRQERCMRIENRWTTGDAFFRSLNKKGRNNHTRGQRILGEIGGPVRFEVIESGAPAAAVLTEILHLKALWLRGVEPESPLLGSDGPVLRSILDCIWGSGLAKIFLLRSGDRIAAASINFVYGNRMEAYLTAYDAAFDRASPGTILIVDYAQWAFDRGLSHVDFLRGEEAFKFRMANGEALLNSFDGARTLIGHLAVTSHRLFGRRRQRQGAAADLEAAE